MSELASYLGIGHSIDGHNTVVLVHVKNGVPASPSPPVACLDTKRNQSGSKPHCGEPARSQRVSGLVDVGKPKRIGDKGQDREHQGRVGPSQRDSTSQGQEASVNNHQGLARMGVSCLTNVESTVQEILLGYLYQLQKGCDHTVAF
ncbi:hypothetical protein C8F01DRAFT_1091227 [Mycena amicta]|nr:hypothetical protein C8F01DRAFT_1091227 [Mycena amicta]